MVQRPDLPATAPSAGCGRAKIAGMPSADEEIRILTMRRRLSDLRDEVVRRGEAIENAYADLAESMLAGARALAKEAAEADFSPPPYPPASGRAIELKLSQTREMTLRLGPKDQGPS